MLRDDLEKTAREYLAEVLEGNNIIDQNTVRGLKPYHLWDHGLWSAANLVRLLQEWGFPPDQQQMAGRYVIESLRAIAAHSEVPGKVSLHENPFGWLLCLCDEMQEWDRSIVTEDRPITETDHIEIENLHEADETDPFYYFEEQKPFVVIFQYVNRKELELTRWNADIFVKSKMERIGRLLVPSELKVWPQKIKLCIRQPDIVDEVNLH
jgi:hypothetical protein